MAENFPTWSQMAGCERWSLVIGPLLMAVAIFLVVRTLVLVRRRKRTKPAKGEISGSVLATILISAIALGHLSAYVSVLNGLRWRNDPDEITEIRIERFRGWRGDMDRIGEPVVFADRATIREGFAKLINSVPFHSQHEHYLDGYRIQLKTAGSDDYSERYLTIYAHTNRHEVLSVVIPHIGPIDSGGWQNAGEYSCEAFHAWFSAHIAPMIVVEKPSTKHRNPSAKEPETGKTPAFRWKCVFSCALLHFYK